MMARNFDFPYGTAMILHTTPDNGYESITTFSTDFFGFGENYKPEGFQSRIPQSLTLPPLQPYNIYLKMQPM